MNLLISRTVPTIYELNTSSIFLAEIRKTPNISKAHCETNCSKNELHLVAPSTAALQFYLRNFGSLFSNYILSIFIQCQTQVDSHGTILILFFCHCSNGSFALQNTEFINTVYSPARPSAKPKHSPAQSNP